MECRLGYEYCPFKTAKEEIKNRFLLFERVLREIRERLYEEIEQREREWRRDILKLKKVRQMVGQEIPADSFVFLSRQRLLDSCELEIQLNLELKPIIEIVWNNSANLFELKPDTLIAQVTHRIPDQDICTEKFPASRSYSNSFTSGFSSYQDTDATPVSKDNFSFDECQMKKTRSVNSFQSLGEFECYTHNHLLNLPTHLTYSTPYLPKESTHLKLARKADNSYHSRSLPQSPILQTKLNANSHLISQSFDTVSPVEEHDPKQRDVMFLKGEDRRFDYLGTSPGYTRQETVRRNSNYKSKQERSNVRELKKNFEKNSQNMKN